MTDLSSCVKALDPFAENTLDIFLKQNKSIALNISNCEKRKPA